MRLISCCLVVSMAFLQSGCSFFRSSKQNLHVATIQGGAQIFLNGEYAGEDPVDARVRGDEDMSIIAKKEGFKTATYQIGTRLSTTGILDIIGGCFILIPFLGLLAPGAHQLNMSSLTLQLDPEVKPGGTLE